ncbi:MAG TPA: 2,3-bisphosphoglycerate-independent phosphoglycerate mutase [Bacillota bacterium]|nr:2,3-bisphosphoglycerate-independent phosphoglycerate mutase [Bacillota bacterium]HQJ38033.1 2,3-bisphosphoglycerate-independent phosphoglycerate mutase [Bacillota bacterium]HQL35592.1 2,3-bisphosphoglycerate-independent phosphoglycerate mutase [Bacillota bacterium]
MSKRPVVLVVMDGIGISDEEKGNAVKAANTPTLDMLMNHSPYTLIKAHGTAVGLPSDEDMGNSEVGHNALGSGQIFSQGAKLVNESIENGKMYNSDTWRKIAGNCIANGSALHFIGLLSDGNVHSNIAHLKSMIIRAKEDKIKKVRIHALLDGRDVLATSALDYVEQVEKLFKELNDGSFDGRIASGGGRMKITMDRYEANWDMVKLGWDTHVWGKGRQFGSASEAICTYREELPGVIDQDLPPFVIAENGIPIGTINDGDSVVLFNFRGDRALEISMAFDYEDFDKFERGRYPKVMFCGMLQYDGDLKLPKNFLVSPPDIKNTLSEHLVKYGIKQYAVSETQKYGHVTYFWNGNRTEKFDDELEDFEEIPSDRVSFDERPWMKAAEVTDKLIEALKSGKYEFLRANYPNGDMVGHTGSFNATRIAVEAVDLCLARVIKAVDEAQAIIIITADHGNADEMLEKTKGGTAKAKTSHTLNPVPFIIYDKMQRHEIKEGNFGLANIAATVTTLLGIDHPDCWEESIV